ncbi:SDR family NAD(P)-dependent oxidoreductase [Saccharothrix sp. HUAS TT1]|uniref:SDR family NAD(P)-dependent oxidoreductase n=1 Tax=unclassified Saccharothrix TaxID=2593673 RepID=UPI00345C600B
MGTTLMTGASRGLGRQAAEHLLRHHPDRHLLVFNRRPGLAAELTRATGNGNVSEVVCDLASFADVRRAAVEAEGAEVEGPLDGFLGNAGLQMASTRKVTADGFEMTFGVNVLAYHLLLNLLRPRFADPARIVVVASDVHDSAHNSMGLVPPPRWTDPRDLARPGEEGTGVAGRRAYATSKLGVIYLVHALRRRLPEGVDVYSYNPGLVPGTGLARDAGRVGQAVFGVVGAALRVLPTVTGKAKAGRLLAEAVVGPRPGDSGSYISRGEVVPSSPESYDERREEELWAVADELCGLTAERRR